MVRFPAGTTVSSLLQNVRADSGAHKASYLMGTWGLRPVKKLTRHPMSRLKLSTAIPPILILLYGGHRKDFTFRINLRGLVVSV